MFSNQNGIKLEINERGTWETNKYVDIKQYIPK